MDSDRPGTRPVSDPAFSGRLDTWKEVAAHLRRSVRTVQRWEREEGLPVHRHLHDKLGSIYAFKAELDAWWLARGAELDGPAARTTRPAGRESARPRVETGRPGHAATTRRPGGAPSIFRRRPVLAGGVGAAIAAGLLTAVVVTPFARSTPASGSGVRWILISEIDDLAGDGPWSERVRHGLEHGLASAGIVHIVPRDRVEDVLRLMRRPVGTPVDEAVGREICLRDGAIDALITARLARVKATYLVDVRVLAPGDAAVIGSFSAQADDPWRLLDAVRRQAAGLGKILRARPALDHDRPGLEKVTTASLDALQLYSEAVALMDQVPVKAGPAFTLLTEAIRKDPDFASAHILAAWALRNGGEGKEAYLPYAGRAYELVDATSAAERYYILGSYYQMKQEAEKAVAAYEALLRVAPAHYWALGNLGRLYREMGRYGAASGVRARQVEMRPSQFWGAYSLAEALFLQGDFDGARRYAAQAATLASRFDSGELRSRTSWLQILPACEAWLKNDVAVPGRLALELEGRASNQPGADRDALALGLGYMYLTLGHLQSAERLFGRLPRGEGRDYHLAVVAAHHGAFDRVAAYTREVAGSASPSTFILGLPALDARLLPVVGDLLAKWDADPGDPDVRLVRGQAALVRGQAAEAAALLGDSIRLREDRFGPPALVAREGLARAWAQQGDWQEAVRVLEEASQHRSRSCLWPAAGGHVWLRLRADLAQLYRRVGREAEAHAIEAELRQLLQSADGRHPLVVRLNSRAAARPSDSPRQARSR